MRIRRICFEPIGEDAQAFGERWVVLSAKYGFIDPDFEIPAP
jgi:hypothetical protein